MLKNLTAFILIALAFAWNPAALAQGGAGQSKDSGQELEYLVRTNDLFIRAAAKAVEKSGNAEAGYLLKKAKETRANGQGHYEAGETQPAIDDYSESTHLAIHAIIIVKGEQGLVMRESAINTDDIIRAGEDRDLKEALIKKGASEVETFIKAAERLLRDGEVETAGVRLAEARRLYGLSKAELSGGEYGKAQDDVNKAYRAATDAVRAVKLARAEIMTFPRPASSNEKDVLVAEVKKNDAYRFFAEQVAPDNDGNIARRIKKGKTLRSHASDAIGAGDAKKALDLLGNSTGVYIEAIKMSVK